ncbi:hypothetical protein GGR56DRAFT_74705 [Xylariaceae sp. FL0804]|nr:hypothetical protein GGR56DRAFT_74705 [Xylariaceae sp. FL0804]
MTRLSVASAACFLFTVVCEYVPTATYPRGAKTWLASLQFSNGSVPAQPARSRAEWPKPRQVVSTSHGRRATDSEAQGPACHEFRNQGTEAFQVSSLLGTGNCEATASRWLATADCNLQPVPIVDSRTIRKYLWYATSSSGGFVSKTGIARQIIQGYAEQKTRLLSLNFFRADHRGGCCPPIGPSTHYYRCWHGWKTRDVLTRSLQTAAIPRKRSPGGWSGDSGRVVVCTGVRGRIEHNIVKGNLSQRSVDGEIKS